MARNPDYMALVENAQEADVRGDHIASARFYLDALEVGGPGKERAYCQASLALIFAKLSNEPDALLWAVRAVNEDMEGAMPWHTLGLVAYGLDCPKLAVEAVRRSVASRGPIATAYLDLGRFEREAGQIDQSCETLSDYVASHPDDPKGHYELGLTYRERARIEEAIESFKRALELEPSESLARRIDQSLVTVRRKQD